MTEKKAIYYSKKMNKYYFCDVNAFGEFTAVTVYNGHSLKGGEIKTDKNGKRYILGVVEQVVSKEGRKYWKCLGYVPTKKEEEVITENE